MKCPHCKNEYRGRGARDRLALHLETHEPWTPADEARVAELRATWRKPGWSIEETAEYRRLATAKRSRPPGGGWLCTGRAGHEGGATDRHIR